MNQNDRDAFEETYLKYEQDDRFDSPLAQLAYHHWQAATERSGERIRVLKEALLKINHLDGGYQTLEYASNIAGKSLKGDRNE